MPKDKYSGAAPSRKELLREIIEHPPAPTMMSIYPKMFIQTMLPYKDPRLTGELRPGGYWVHQQGAVRLRIKHGKHPQTDEPLDIPHGGLARLIFSYLVTEAKRTESPTIDLGESIADLMRQFGIRKGGYRYPTLRRALLSVFLCRVEHINARRRKETYALGMEQHLVARHVRLWEAEDLGSDEMGSGELIGEAWLTPEMWAYATEDAVPIDRRVLQYYRGKPLAQDVYMWLIHKAYLTQRLDMDLRPIAWKTLWQDFPTTHSVPQKFRSAFLEVVGEMRRSFWPKLQVRTPRGRLQVMKCPPHVPIKHREE